MAETGSTQIQVAYPQKGSLQLRLDLATCKLSLRPSEDEAWVSGAYDDLEGGLPLDIQQDGPTLRITRTKPWLSRCALRTGWHPWIWPSARASPSA